MPDEHRFDKNCPPEINFNQLFVFADIIKPGKHEYIVSYENLIIEKEPVVPEQPSTRSNERI